VSRHARRDAAGEPDGERPGGYGPSADDDPVAADWGPPGHWPQDDPAGNPGDAGGLPRPSGRRHARHDAQTPEQPWTPERTGAAGQNSQAAEPFRWTPDRGGATPDPYEWAPGHGGGTPGHDAPAGYGTEASYGTEAAYDAPAGYGSEAGYGTEAAYDAPAGYGTEAGYGAEAGSGAPAGYGTEASYDAEASSGTEASYGAPASYDAGAVGYSSGASDYLDAPSRYGGELPGYNGSQHDHGSTASGYGNGAPLSTAPPWHDDGAAVPLAPLPPPSPHPPPPSLDSTGHPSGPLPPLPPSELAWRQSLADPLLDESAPEPRADDHPGDRSYPDSAATGDPGYQAYGDGPRDRRASVAKEARENPAAGGWYADVEEPPAAEDEDGLLPGLGEGRSVRRRAERASGTASSRRRRKRGRIAVLAAGTVILLIVVAVLGVGYTYWRKYYSPADFAGSGTGSVVAQVKTGDTATVVGQRLASLGVVESARAFSIAAKDSTHGTALEPGYYHLRKHMKASLAFALLLKPSSRIQTTVAIPEGYRLSQIITKLGNATGNLKGYQQAATKVASLGLPSYANGNTEGYLFPATYDIQPNTPPLTVLKNMVLRFDQEAASISLSAAAARVQLTPSEVIIVASLIQAEGKRPQDLPKIARVIYNRLNSNPQMPLELDTTVLYALHSSAGDVTIKQTQFKSPYNTYLHAGLPPGPIDSPGDLAIQAALHPAHGNWTYFLTVNPTTGLTLFTNSFTQFQQFQTELTNNTGNG
jgi:UPF0755 protein